jgi:hypothetical protein
MLTLRIHDLEAQINSQTGRIICFTKAGDSNVLWVATNPERVGTWTNWGGEKAWVWPQAAWPQIWPPLATMDGSEWQVVQFADTEVVLESPLIAELGVRISRQYRLEAEALVIITTLSQISETNLSLAPWVVAQVPVPQQVLADGEVVPLVAGDAGKTFSSAQQLEAVYQGYSLTLSTLQAGYAQQAQVYHNQALGYIELEMAGEPRQLALGERYSLTTTLQIVGKKA